MSKPYVLGMDAGGTRTRCIIADLGGTVLGYAEGAAANVASDREGAARSLHATAEHAVRAAGVSGPAEAACAGVAGYSSFEPHDAEALFMAVASARRWETYPDLHIAWAGGTGGRPGVVVIGGTGSVAFGRNAAGQEHRCGGWGYLLSDEGSGFWIGRQALIAVLKCNDGRGPETLLTERVAAAIGAEGAGAIVRYAYTDDRSTREFARLAPLVTAASEDGDAVARRILAGAGRHLGALGATTIRVLGMERDAFPVVTVGGAYRAGLPLLETFRDRIAEAAPDAVVGPPRSLPVIGAVILALTAAGHPPDEAALARLEATLETG
jgi:N-acetylglucosamine kinase-like BadF-type ATPase